jgi:hypothetical protein
MLDRTTWREPWDEPPDDPIDPNNEIWRALEAVHVALGKRAVAFEPAQFDQALRLFGALGDTLAGQPLGTEITQYEEWSVYPHGAALSGDGHAGYSIEHPSEPDPRWPADIGPSPKIRPVRADEPLDPRWGRGCDPR